MHLLQEGGVLFMYSLLVLLILNIGLIVKGFTQKGDLEKTKSLLGSIGLFALVFGFLGQVLGLINAFDMIQSIGNVSPEILAGGLKVSFLTTAFGALVFLVSRLGIILFTVFRK